MMRHAILRCFRQMSRRCRLSMLIDAAASRRYAAAIFFRCRASARHAFILPLDIAALPLRVLRLIADICCRCRTPLESRR